MNRLTIAAAALLLAACGTHAYDQAHPPTVTFTPAATAPAQATSATPDPGLIDAFGHDSLIAHRGGAGRYPEASMKAYRAAAAAGFPLEMDLQPLKYGTLVLMHDATVDRTTNGHGRPEDFTLDEWKQLTVKGGTLPPPTFKQILDNFGGKVLLVPEPKDRSVVARMIQLVTDRGLTRDVLAQSFNVDDVKATAAAGIPSMLLTFDAPTGLDALEAAGIGYVGLHSTSKTLTKDVQRVEAAGLDPSVWMVEDARKAGELFGEGVGSVFTNDPWKLKASHPIYSKTVQRNADPAPAAPAPAPEPTPESTPTQTATVEGGCAA